MKARKHTIVVSLTTVLQPPNSCEFCSKSGHVEKLALICYGCCTALQIPTDAMLIQCNPKKPTLFFLNSDRWTAQRQLQLWCVIPLTYHKFYLEVDHSQFCKTIKVFFFFIRYLKDPIPSYFFKRNFLGGLLLFCVCNTSEFICKQSSQTILPDSKFGRINLLISLQVMCNMQQIYETELDNTVYSFSFLVPLPRFSKARDNIDL